MKRYCDLPCRFVFSPSSSSKVMTRQISAEQEEKTSRIQALVRCYGDGVEANRKLLEGVASSMEESDMAAFVQVGSLFRLVQNAGASGGIILKHLSSDLTKDGRHGFISSVQISWYRHCHLLPVMSFGATVSPVVIKGWGHVSAHKSACLSCQCQCPRPFCITQ